MDPIAEPRTANERNMRIMQAEARTVDHDAVIGRLIRMSPPISKSGLVILTPDAASRLARSAFSLADVSKAVRAARNAAKRARKAR